MLELSIQQQKQALEHDAKMDEIHRNALDALRRGNYGQ